jgi:hypothetical protein
MISDSEHKPTHPVTRNKICILTKYFDTNFEVWNPLYFDTNYIDSLVLRVMEIDSALYIKSYIYCTHTRIVVNFNLSKHVKNQFSLIYLYREIKFFFSLM